MKETPILMPLDDSKAAQAGVVMAANEQSSFNQTHFSEPLTGYVAGLPDDTGLQELLDFIAPPVQAPRRFEYRKDETARGLAESDDVRAIDVAFKEVRSAGKLENSRTLNKGLTYLIDRDRIAVDVPNFEQSAIAWLRGMLLRQEILRGMAGLVAAAVTKNVAWTTASDPDADMLLAIAGAADVDGLEKNRGIAGGTLLLKRKLIYQGKVGNSALVARGALTMQDLAEYLMLEEFRKISARQKSGTAYPPVYRNSAIFYNATPSPMIDDPSHIKRVWSPCDGGGMWKVYREERGPKLVALTLEHYSQLILPFTIGITRILDANSAATPTPPTTD